MSIVDYQHNSQLMESSTSQMRPYTRIDSPVAFIRLQRAELELGHPGGRSPIEDAPWRSAMYAGRAWMLNSRSLRSRDRLGCAPTQE